TLKVFSGCGGIVHPFPEEGPQLLSPVPCLPASPLG
nr:methyltransferase (EC 2.1.1.-) (clone 11) - Arabidopsis thaliana (fragments) [Arabidopsis thaliana]